MVLFYSGMLVINSTMGSALPSMAIPKITGDYGVTSQSQMVLPISVYLIGYVFGPIIWGPLSEHLGRRLLSIITFTLFSIFTMACGFAHNWPAFLIFRFFCGVFGSAPIAVVAGILADVYGEPKIRGRAFAIFMVVSIRPFSTPNLVDKSRDRQPSSGPCSVPSFPATAPPASDGAGPSGSPPCSVP